MISDESIEQALDYLKANAQKAAQAKAEREYMEAYLKVIKSELMSEVVNESIGAQERHAYSHERYKEHLKALREAIALDERQRFMRNAAEAQIEAWRTMCSNNRAQGKIG